MNTKNGSLLIAVVLCLIAQDAIGQTGPQYVIDTVAGTGKPEDNGDLSLAVESNVGDPFGVEIGPDGALYVCEVRNHRIRRVDLNNGSIRTVAGTGVKGYSGDGGPAVKAEMNEPYEIRFDAEGNLYCVEMQNHVVRRIDAATGIITTVAGNGTAGFSGDDGPATEAQMRRPHSIALDQNDGLYVADIGNHRIRKIDLLMGRIETIAGSDQKRLPEEGQVAKGSPILGPRALFIVDETLWIALREGNSIWRMSLADGILHHISGTGEASFQGDGGAATDAAYKGPKGIAVGPKGDVYVVDTENHAIRHINTRAGTVRTVAGAAPKSGGAGDGGLATAALMDRPHGICVDKEGVIYVGDTLNHRVRRLRPRASNDEEDERR